MVWQDAETVAWCAEMGVFYQAYSSLRGLLDGGDPSYAPARQVLRAIGERHGANIAQVALRWEIQHGHGVIPRSHHPAHLNENLDALGAIRLSEEDMAAIDALGVRQGEARDEL